MTQSQPLMNAKQKYLATWSEFPNILNEAYQGLHDYVYNSEHETLHMLAAELFGIPYHRIRAALQHPKVEANPINIGAVTGIFFEQLMASILIPAIKMVIPNIRCERNCCTHPIISKVASNPDIFISNGEARVVVELKVSPKKMDLEPSILMRSKYSNIGVSYYLIGGYVSASDELLKSCDPTWCVFLEGSESNKSYLQQYSLDKLVTQIQKDLQPQ